MFRIRHLLLLLLIPAAWSVFAADKYYDSLPDEGRKRLERISAHSQASTIVLYSVRKNWMGSTGIQAYQVHELRYIGDSAGVTEWKEIKIPFVDGRDSVEVTNATLYFPEGEPYDADPETDMSVMSAQGLKDAADFMRFKEFEVRLPKLRVGAIIELKYRVIINKPLVPWEGGRCDLAATEPVLYREYLTKVPVGDTTTFSLDNGAPPPRIDSNFAVWYLPEARGYALDTLRALLDEIPSVQWTSLDDWNPVIAWFRERLDAAVRDSLVLPESLTRRLTRVKEGPSRLDLVRSWAAGNLKLINYPYHRDFPFTLRSSAQVLKSGYGNALEIAVLVRNIGLQLGVTSDVVLRFDREPKVPQLADWRGVFLAVGAGESRKYVLPQWTDTGKNVDMTDSWLLPLSDSNPSILRVPAPHWN